MVYCIIMGVEVQGEVVVACSGFAVELIFNFQLIGRPPPAMSLLVARRARGVDTRCYISCASSSSPSLSFRQRPISFHRIDCFRFLGIIMVHQAAQPK
jgi:hypothetical protein